MRTPEDSSSIEMWELEKACDCHKVVPVVVAVQRAVELGFDIMRSFHTCSLMHSVADLRKSMNLVWSIGMQRERTFGSWRYIQRSRCWRSEERIVIGAVHTAEDCTKVGLEVVEEEVVPKIDAGTLRQNRFSCAEQDLSGS